MTREEAIKIIKSNCSCTDSKLREACAMFIPELAESEDERIRKIIRLALIASEDELSDFYKVHNTSRKECTDWLEKQKESLHIHETCKENANSFTDEDEMTRKGLIHHLKELREWKAGTMSPIKVKEHYDVWIAYLEKQKEQKQIVQWPNLSNCKHDCKTCFAKCIYRKEQNEEPKPVEWTELTWKDINELEGIINKVHYEFRNGIGQESFGKEVLEKFREYKGDEYLDEIEQKPAEWSEEDNIGWDEAFACVTRAEKAAKNEEELQNAVTAEKWLKEIKFKYYVHPVKQEWSEEDEKIVRFYEADYNNQIGDMSMKDVIDMRLKFRDWLVNRLKDLRPQPNTVSVKSATKFGNLEYERGVKDGIQHAKNHQWKPSEEQMEALEECGECKRCIKELREQLKKL